MERLWSPWRLDYVTGSKADVGCVFCTEQSVPESDSLIVHVGSRCYVILNRFPYNPGHLMVLPKRHVPALADLSPDELHELADLTRLSEAALVDAYRPQGINVGINLGLSAGAGTYQLSGGATSLVHAESDRDDLRVTRADVSGDRADVRLDQGPTGTGFRFGPTAASHVTVRVASDVATSLTVDAGAGEFTIDTSDIKVTDARISVGAASVRFVLPHPTGDVPITISAGASSIVVEVPAGVEARITSTGGLNSTHFENPRFSGSETSGYASGKDRVIVRITSGVTSIVVR